MDVRQEIARRVEKLPPESQEQVLRFVASLPASVPVGEKGADLRQFASSIDSVSAGQMIQAIEEECERIDAGESVDSCSTRTGLHGYGYGPPQL